MAKFTFDPPTDFLKQLGKLAKIDEIAPKMLDESVPIVQNKLKKELSWHVGTGDLQESIKVTKAKAVKNGGYYNAAVPTGMSTHYIDEKGITRERATPIRNAEKLAYIEYGTSKKSARPIITRTLNDSEGSVLYKMQEVFEREVSK